MHEVDLQQRLTHQFKGVWNTKLATRISTY
jgi:hypothetical protein